MEAKFWHKKWEQGITGFHRPDVNPLLVRYWPELGLNNEQVLVPLCGKSLDMAYLAGEGHSVLGCELSPIAVNGFFSELGQTPTQTTHGDHLCYQLDEITLLQGDFFKLMPDQLSPCPAFYDRGALIALPPAMREEYVTHFTQLIAAGAQGLLVVLDYYHPHDQHLFGPPFAVSEQEIQRLYGDAFEITKLEQQDILAKSPKFSSKGVQWMTESVYRLQKRS